LSSVTTAQSGNKYQAVFTNSQGSVTSSAATLTVTAALAAPTISTQPTSQSVTAGQTASFTAAANGNPTPTVQWQMSAAGSTTFTNISGATSGTLTLSSVTTAQSGNKYQAVFTNSQGSVTSSAATLTVTSALTADFTLSASPYTITQGGNGTSTITVTPQNGFTGSVALSASNVPNGVTASTFNPASTATTSVLTLTASSTAATGTYSMTITGTSGSLTHTATLNLTVKAAATPDFMLYTMPSSLTITQGASGTSTITISPSGGLNSSTVSLSVAGLPTGVTGSYSPISTTGTSTMTLTASSTATTGNSLVTVTGTYGSLTHTATIMLTVNSASSTTSLVVSPSSLTFNYQSGGSMSGAQYLKVTDTSAKVWYSVSTSGGPWLMASATNGKTPGTITVSVSAGNMSQGTYSGMIQVSAQGTGSVSVPVTLNVTPYTGCGTACGVTAAMYAEPYVYDPTSSGTLYAQWVNRLGAPTGNPTSPVDPGLLLSKNATAPTGSLVGAYIRNVTGSLTELGFDYRAGGQCTTTSPRFLVVTTDAITHVIGGCSLGTTTPLNLGTTPVVGWNRVRFNLADATQANPPILPGEQLTSITLVLDYGPESGATAAGGMVVIDNIDVNGTFAGKGLWSSTGY
jgi:hypothetical protein